MSSTPSSAAVFPSLFKQAWPILIGQLAVMCNSLIDTAMAGRLSAADLAAIGLGGSIHITVYVTLMGVIMGLGPIVGQQYGARRFDEIGKTVQQAIWVACLLAVLGCALLLANPIWLKLMQADAQVAPIASSYLNWYALGLPAALGFRVFYATSSAVSLPKVVMLIQLTMLALKIPANALFMYGVELGPLSIPAMGGAGCGLATALLAWVGLAFALRKLRTDKRYKPFRITLTQRPDKVRLRELLTLGIPIGLSYGFEVASFTAIAMLIAHLGVDVLASHQIASNLLGMAYMFALALSNATSTLVAQAIGAEQPDRAKLVAVLGIKVVMAMACSIGVCYFFFAPLLASAYLGAQPALVNQASYLIKILAFFIVADAFQTILAFVLRAYKIASGPTVIYAVCLWVIGIGGGVVLSKFHAAPWSAGAAGYWWAGGFGLLLAGLAFAVMLRRVWRP